MKVSYSKMILSGVIATTFFMVSCQKKGTATGVKPTAAKVDPSKPAAEENKEVPTEGREPFTPISSLNPAGTKSADSTIKANIPNLSGRGAGAKAASSDTSVVASSDTSMASSSDTTSAKVEKKTEAKKEEVKPAAQETKVDTTEDKYCSAEIVNALKVVSDKYKIVAIQANNKAVEAKEKIAALNADIKACEAFEAVIVKSKIETCLVKTSKQDLEVTANYWDKNCDYAGVKAKELSGQDNKYAQRVEKAAKEILKTLQAEKLVVSEEAKPLFEKENQNWGMYIIDGTVQHDSSTLNDSIAKNKVACTITATPEKYSDSVMVTLQVSSIAPYAAKNKSDTIKSGVDISVLVKTEITEEKSADSTKAVLSCTNLSATKLDIKKLKAALGSHIAIEVVKEEASEKVTLD